MSKVFLLVIVLYNNAPMVTHRGITKNMDDCYAQAIMITKNAPDDEHVVKYMVGCSFEEPLPSDPT